MKRLIILFMLVSMWAGAVDTFIRVVDGAWVVENGVIQVGEEPPSGWTDTNNPVARYWMQDTNAAVAIADSSGNGYDGTPLPSVATGPTYTNLGARTNASGDEIARYFDGIDDAVDISSTLASLASTTEGTWNIWVKPTDSTPSGREEVITFSDASASRFIRVNVETSGQIRCLASDTSGGKWVLTTDNKVLSDNVWTHIALIHNGTQAFIIIDGVFVAQTFGSSPSKNYWFNNFGGNLDTGRICSLKVNGGSDLNFFSGLVDDPRIYTISFSGAEVLVLYNNTGPRPLGSIENRLGE